MSAVQRYGHQDDEGGIPGTPLTRGGNGREMGAEGRDGIERTNNLSRSRQKSWKNKRGENRRFKITLNPGPRQSAGFGIWKPEKKKKHDKVSGGCLVVRQEDKAFLSVLHRPCFVPCSSTGGPAGHALVREAQPASQPARPIRDGARAPPSSQPLRASQGQTLGPPKPSRLRLGSRPLSGAGLKTG
ncbi:uncharacterized protein VTP21DRAFT_1257 [Calcarisporiella thermophila]|uniref:uncharacterized protein n=1 Tax=Calcarisporiella thermophila TaxID=911321 RepID=UPI0037428D75